MLDSREANLDLDHGRISDPASGESSPCTLITVKGHVIRLRSAQPFGLGASVRVEAQNRLWMGEVWVCQPGDSGFFLEIEVCAVLNDVAGVSLLASRFRQEKGSRPATAASEPEYSPLRSRGNPKQIA